MDDQIKQRVERLEKNTDQLWSAMSTMRDQISAMAQTLTKVQVTLENIADAVEKIVDGRGTVRCVEHQLGLQGVRQDLQRCAEDKAERLGVIQGEFVAFRTEMSKASKANTARIVVLEESRKIMAPRLTSLEEANIAAMERIAALEDANKATTNQRKGAMLVVAAIGAVLGTIIPPLFKYLLGG